MLPRDSRYGGWPASGEIDLMESRVDNIEVLRVNIENGGFWQKGGFGGNNPWSGGTKAAPFDQAVCTDVDHNNDDDDNDDDDDYDNTKYAKCDTKNNLSKINLSNKSHQTHHNKYKNGSGIYNNYGHEEQTTCQGVPLPAIGMFGGPAPRQF
ncbi:hypothetical protein DPMN_176240 [Dreissena polymorpha]|uniref:Uncharacterized protein n=1 Tax=Dreissena polymorpha TaxID=45954 RepID=A0A9D4IJG3_DREPO|nr:hypothetical protein DPMN_176240 [Dreissena polymorpha]